GGRLRPDPGTERVHELRGPAVVEPACSVLERRLDLCRHDGVLLRAAVPPPSATPGRARPEHRPEPEAHVPRGIPDPEPRHRAPGEHRERCGAGRARGRGRDDRRRGRRDLRLMAHVALIRAPYITSAHTFSAIIDPPLGLAYVAAALESAGHTVTLVDSLG